MVLPICDNCTPIIDSTTTTSVYIHTHTHTHVHFGKEGIYLSCNKLCTLFVYIIPLAGGLRPPLLAAFHGILPTSIASITFWVWWVCGVCVCVVNVWWEYVVGVHSREIEYESSWAIIYLSSHPSWGLLRPVRPWPDQYFSRNIIHLHYRDIDSRLQLHEYTIIYSLRHTPI